MDMRDVLDSRSVWGFAFFGWIAATAFTGQVRISWEDKQNCSRSGRAPASEFGRLHTRPWRRQGRRRPRRRLPPTGRRASGAITSVNIRTGSGISQKPWAGASWPGPHEFVDAHIVMAH